ncbi:DUF58 domain-containing protein [Pleionea litopenaei]|uniref:DUF58 domain-containing protein n=1 Tax=Pleionea litopenaei TaxID=3070815 RepID=A0AA51X5I4_9GAMM|nr:DUF58 domain-containing protein [Pleionea sp. HL-JVS1]WMS85824.1 DUF58 domain-containing protein [Pleionea sp. HL-JVS1]
MRPSVVALYSIAVWIALALVTATLKVLASSFDWDASYAETFYQIWYWFGIGLGGVAILDLISMRLESVPQAYRSVNKNVAVGSQTKVQLNVRHKNSRKINFIVNDHYPEHSQVEDLPQSLILDQGQVAKLQYSLRVLKRGDASFGKIRVISRSRFNLWDKVTICGSEETIKVYPNFAAIHHYLLLSADQQQSQMGIRLSQRRGDGLEFHQLREYRIGDSIRQIDWRASSRLNKLISKEYQEEKDQNIVFLLDCGRRMRTQDDQLSHFDHSLNAMLMLGYIGLKQGDAVGLSTFGGLSRWLPPQKGTYFINSLMNQVYDCHPTLQASDFIEAATELNKRIRKRSLVVLISNCRNEDWVELEPAIRLLNRHHLVMLANLREQAIDDIMDTPVDSFESAQRYAETSQFFAQRQSLNTQCSVQGVVSVDTAPKHLATEIVNQYFKIKRSGKL